MNNEPDERARSGLTAVLPALIILALFPVVVFFAYRGLLGRGDSVSKLSEQARTPRSSQQEVPAAEASAAGELTLHRVPGFEHIPIYDVVATEGAVWLGTGKGLLKFNPRGPSVLYRHYSDAPREWVQHVAVAQGAVACSTMLAPGNVAGTPAGTFVFRPGEATWQRIGDWSRALVFEGGRLWAYRDARLVTWAHSLGEGPAAQPSTIELPRPECRQAALAARGGVLWLAREGSLPGRRRRPVGCGVTAIAPDGTRETFERKDGLASDFAAGIVADKEDVWVSHGVRGEGLSRLERVSGRWEAVLRGADGRSLSAHVLALGSRALWLGTSDVQMPLVRLDRGSRETEVFEGLPPEHFVNAIGVSGADVWIALHRKTWDGPGYEVESLLAHYVEQD